MFREKNKPNTLKEYIHIKKVYMNFKDEGPKSLQPHGKYAFLHINAKKKRHEYDKTMNI